MSKERLDKVISNLGILSRSECKKACKRGEIKLNGSIIYESDTKVDIEGDVIFYLDEILDTKRFVYYMLNKPAGVITANDDKYSDTVFDLISDRRTDLSAVGRLDKDTTGILLITNDGDLNHRLLSPRYHVEKTYDVICDGILSLDDIALLERGIDIGDEKPTLPAKCEIINSSYPNEVRLIITEGRFHQVKRMFQAINKPVIKLHRSKFGPLELDLNLGEGEYRSLSEEEVEMLLLATGKSEN